MEHDIEDANDLPDGWDANDLPDGWDAAKFKAARERLGLTQRELGRILNTSDTTIRKWEAPPEASTARQPNPVAAQVMRWMLAGFRPPEWPQGKR